MRLPDLSRDCIYDKFDPVSIINDIAAEELPGYIDALLDYSGNDAGFIELMRTRAAAIIVKVLREMDEGFIDGINDILVFFKSNLINLTGASGSR